MVDKGESMIFFGRGLVPCVPAACPARYGHEAIEALSSGVDAPVLRAAVS